jgi:hypothetical protein
METGERARIVPGAETLGDDLVLLSVSPNSGRIMTKQKIGYGLMGAELVRLAATYHPQIPWPEPPPAECR